MGAGTSVQGTDQIRAENTLQGLSASPRVLPSRPPGRGRPGGGGRTRRFCQEETHRRRPRCAHGAPGRALVVELDATSGAGDQGPSGGRLGRSPGGCSASSSPTRPAEPLTV